MGLGRNEVVIIYPESDSWDEADEADSQNLRLCSLLGYPSLVSLALFVYRLLAAEVLCQPFAPHSHSQ